MRWPRFQHVVFDCDSTLTAVEGIDVLAEGAGLGEEVAKLTQAAMDGEIELEAIYGERLRQIEPSRAGVMQLRDAYKAHVVPDARQVIEVLIELGHDVYIVSGGLEEPVLEFGVSLGVPTAHIKAVGLSYDRLAGQWWSQTARLEDRYLDHSAGALAMSAGKEEVVGELVGDGKGGTVLIGDGVSDLLARGAVDLFIGFGGVIRRPRVEAEAAAFITSQSLSPVLPLAAGPSAGAHLADLNHAKTFRRGLELSEHEVTFSDGDLGAAYQTARSLV